ncbi:MAG: hypothetical protein IJU91_08460, partial [Selenomonadaceae bacterium]|nr:hypothetical protein [Selenomonadaceae bacterium]
SQSALARYLNLTQARVNQLIGEGIVIRSKKETGVLVADSIKNYFVDKSKREDTETVNFWQEKGLHERAKRELVELKLAKARGQVYDAKVVEQALEKMLTTFRTNLTGLAHRLPAELAYCTEEEMHDVLAASFENLLAELSNFDTKSLAEEGDDE